MKTDEEIGRAIRHCLAAQAAANRAAGDALRAEVRAVLDQHETEGQRLTGKQVLKCLTRNPLPSVRRVQEVLQEIRAQSSASRIEIKHTESQNV